MTTEFFSWLKRHSGEVVHNLSLLVASRPPLSWARRRAQLRPQSAARGDLVLSVAHPGTVGESFRSQWEKLFERQPAPANPFCAPDWVQTWFRFFTQPHQAVLITVHRADSLVAVLPLYLDTVRIGPVRTATRLVAVGSGQGSALLEQPQPLIAPGDERAVHRLFVSSLVGDADFRASLRDVGLLPTWVELPIPQRHGWFEPEWVTGSGQPVAFHRHQRARASVLLRLEDGWAATRTGLKRNVKESLRRSRNRLKKDGRAWEIRTHTSDIDHTVIDRFVRLHGARAAHADAAARHYDAFAEPTRRAFMHQLLPALGANQRASVLELLLAGDVVASQLLLHAPGTTYVHSSGFTSDVWQFGPTTLLQGAGIEAAADRGERWVNMSPGPNVAKLRWSEHVDVTHDWSFGAGSAATAAQYGLFAAAAAERELVHQIGMATAGGDQGA